MLRVSLALRAAAAHIPKPTKLTTGITGLDVIPNAREVLIRLYEKTLADVQVMSAEVPYRQIVEQTTKHRLEIVKKHDDIAEIESEIGCGQVEELVQQARGELILIPEYASWRLWEEPPASLDEDEFSDVYDDLLHIDPDGPCSPVLRELAAKKRAEKRAQDAAAAGGS